MGMWTPAELERCRIRDEAQLQKCLGQARNPEERAALLAHATEPGNCDAEYCPWGAYPESLCMRAQYHDPNCRCHDCCADDDMDY